MPKGSSFRATPKPSRGSTSQQPQQPQTKYGVKTGSMRSAARSSQQSKQASSNWKGVKSGTRAAKPSGPQPKATTQTKPLTQTKPSTQPKPSTAKTDRSGAKGAAVGAGAAGLLGATGYLLTRAASEKKAPPAGAMPAKPWYKGMRATVAGRRAMYDGTKWVPAGSGK